MRFLGYELDDQGIGFRYLTEATMCVGQLLCPLSLLSKENSGLFPWVKWLECEAN
jgi:hypothetical protein